MLTTSLISYQYNKQSSLKSLQVSIALATKIAKLVHSTQKERGFTSGFLSSSGSKFKFEMQNQRVTSNKRFSDVQRYVTIIKEKAILTSLNKSIIYINKLKMLREKVNKFNTTPQDIITFYSKLNNTFLNIIVEISKNSKITEITQKILAYNNFLYAKENAGIERAIGLAILTNESLNKNMVIEFLNLITIQNLYINTFFKFSSSEAKKFYKESIKDTSINEVKKIRDIIIYGNLVDRNGVKPEYWLSNITQKINKLESVNQYLAQEILKNIAITLESTYKFFVWFMILNIISIIAFLLMIVFIVRLIKSEKRLKDITDKYIISSSTDLKGKLTEVSDAFCDISEYSRRELIGKPHSIIRHPDMPKSAFKELWSTIQSGKSWSGRVKNLKKGGGYYWVYAHIEPLLDKKGVIEGYAAIRLDITDSVHLKEELEISKQKDRTILQQGKLAQMGEMISMIAHQWRQPLSAISSTSSDLHMKLLLQKYEKNYFISKLEKIDELSQHLSKTIDDFRTFYKEDKQKEISYYNDIIRGACNILSGTLDSKDILRKQELNSKAMISVYPNELKQVVLNLIKNAEDILLEKDIKDPEIIIKSYDKNNFAYLQISDNAGGIPMDIIKKVFDPYFSTKTQKDGTGLGLYMSKKIVEEHCAGSIVVSNTQHGALFTIKMPIIEGKSHV